MAYQYRKNTPVLADAGFRVMAVDLPGQGESEAPRDPRCYTVSALATHLRAVLDATGVERASLMGQSLGAAVATVSFRECPDRVERMALLAPVGLAPIPLARVGRLLPRLPPRLLARLGWRGWWSFGLRHAYGIRARPTERDIDEYWAPSRDPFYVAGLLELVRQVDWSPLSPDELASITGPVLVAAGARDPLISCDQIVRRAKKLPNAEVVVIEGAGHPIQEEVPDEVNHALIRFLSR